MNKLKSIFGAIGRVFKGIFGGIFKVFKLIFGGIFKVFKGIFGGIGKLFKRKKGDKAEKPKKEDKPKPNKKKLIIILIILVVLLVGIGVALALFGNFGGAEASSSSSAPEIILIPAEEVDIISIMDSATHARINGVTLPITPGLRTTINENVIADEWKQATYEGSYVDFELLAGDKVVAEFGETTIVHVSDVQEVEYFFPRDRYDYILELVRANADTSIRAGNAEFDEMIFSINNLEGHGVLSGTELEEFYSIPELTIYTPVYEFDIPKNSVLSLYNADRSSYIHIFKLGNDPTLALKRLSHDSYIYFRMPEEHFEEIFDKYSAEAK